MLRSKGRFRDAVELRFRVLQRDAPHVGEELMAQVKQEELREANFLVLFRDGAQRPIAEGAIRYAQEGMKRSLSFKQA